MIDLRLYRDSLLNFLEAGVVEFKRLHPEETIEHIALYCCPWAGWVSLCFNRTAQLVQNGPDFDFHGAAPFEASPWVDAYETSPSFRVANTAGRVVEIDTEVDGDEALNAVFFEFLLDLLQDARARAAIATLNRGSLRVGVQLLDSQWNRAWAFVA